MVFAQPVNVKKLGLCRWQCCDTASRNPGSNELIEQICGNLKGRMALWAPATVLSRRSVTPQSSRCRPCRKNRCAREVQEVHAKPEQSRFKFGIRLLGQTRRRESGGSALLIRKTTSLASYPGCYRRQIVVTSSEQYLKLCCLFLCAALQ